MNAAGSRRLHALVRCGQAIFQQQTFGTIDGEAILFGQNRSVPLQFLEAP